MADSIQPAVPAAAQLPPTAPPARRQTDGQHSIASTTALAYGAAGGGGVVLWLLACLQAGHIATPSNEVVLFMTATLAPIVHAIGRIIIYRLNRWSGEAGN